MKISRRELLRIGAGTSAALLLRQTSVAAQDPVRSTRGQAGGRALEQAREQLMRAIPSSGELVPSMGLGSARTFSVGPSSEERAPLKEVLRLFHEMGGRFFDTAPSYGTAEQVAGELVQELGIQNDLFFATKISTGGGRQAGIDQERGSLRSWGRTTIDLNQVHNLRDVDVHLATIRRAKEEGRTRYVGVTTSFQRQYEQMEQVLRAEELDFVQLNYSLGEREAADRLIPLARDRGMAIIVNEPYNVGRLFGAVRGRSVPEWAAEFDAGTWGQFFLKYILGHPAVTVVIPATSDPEHLVDNMGAGVGRLPDARARQRMEALFDQLS